MLTNPHDTFSGQSRSPNIVPFHVLGMVSSCAIVILSLRGAVFTVFDLLQKMSWPWNRDQRSLKVIETYFKIGLVILITIPAVTDRHPASHVAVAYTTLYYVLTTSCGW